MRHIDAEIKVAFTSGGTATVVLEDGTVADLKEIVEWIAAAEDRAQYLVPAVRSVTS